MSKIVHSSTDLNNTILDHIQSARRKGSSLDLHINSGNRQGIVQIRSGQLLSATTGKLNGNGAVLTLVSLENTTIAIDEQSAPVPKNISLSLEQILHYTSSLQTQSQKQIPVDEEKYLEDALLLFFQFKNKQAAELLLRILRQNRFYYPAWLWQSRLLTRDDYIIKALDEAYRWGNDDRDVWRESRKMRPQLEDIPESVKRCVFCWSLLDEGTTCGHCKASLIVTGQPLASDIKQEEIQQSLVYYHRALEKDPENARIAYTLSLGSFNLKQYEKALPLMRDAVRLSPQSTLYRKSLSLLLTLAKANDRNPEPEARKAPRHQSSQATVMMVEDSKTSRKVLSMLFERLGYRIVEAENGAEAMAKAQSASIDLILLDLMLPDINGHELLPKLRQLKGMKNIPVIMLTGRQDSTDRLLGIQSGASEYVTKPFDPKKLTELVQQYIKKTRDPNKAPLPSLTTNTLKADQPTAPATGISKQQTGESQKRGTPVISPASVKNSQKSIFVIEDSQTSRKVISMILGRNGYHIHEATTGQEALELAPNIQPDLILLDVMLPDTTGYNILPQLKEMPHIKDLPVVMLTGKTAPSDRMKGMLAGSNEYLTKPFNPQKLLSVIRGYL
ncbi:response regulator [Desulfosediminicola sp.]|uniref:response regulator n=1 Tax=Desulfosediminicola sp. TaxID=2886825 RepID=UPI003AF2F797